jgi:hypothetical protein
MSTFILCNNKWRNIKYQPFFRDYAHVTEVSQADNILNPDNDIGYPNDEREKFQKIMEITFTSEPEAYVFYN